MSVNTLNEYINQLNKEQEIAVKDFISFMEKTYPHINLKISFSMPMWLMKQKMNEGYVAISVANKYFTIHFSDEERVLHLKELLPQCKVGKRCINIHFHDKESYQVVKQNVIEHINQII